MAKCECLLVLMMLLLATTQAWKCLYEEFNLDPEKMKGGWYVYGTYPEKIPMCYFEDLDPYWTRITQTDYSSYAVELHCSLPWMRPQMAIYTRAKRPTADTLREIDAYLQSVQLSRDQFFLIRKTRGCKNVKHKPLQIWHLSRYTFLKYHPHYLKPLTDPEMLCRAIKIDAISEIMSNFEWVLKQRVENNLFSERPDSRCHR